MDVIINGRSAGKVVFGLFEDYAPKVAEHFISLCVAEDGKGYKGKDFNLIVPGVRCQGGSDTTPPQFRIDGDEYSPLYAEKGTISFVGILNSEFLIRNQCEALNGKTVVFGRIIAGFDVVDDILMFGSASGSPTNRHIIKNCGVIS